VSRFQMGKSAVIPMRLDFLRTRGSSEDIAEGDASHAGVVVDAHVSSMRAS